MITLKKDLKFKRITYCFGFLFAAFFMIAISNSLSMSVEHSTASGSSISKSISVQVKSLQNINLFNSFIEVSPIFYRSFAANSFCCNGSYDNYRSQFNYYFLVLRT